MKIWDKFHKDEINSMGREVFLRKENIRVDWYIGNDQWCIVNLTNAFLPGKFCTQFSVRGRMFEPNVPPVLNWISSEFDFDMEALFKHLTLLNWVANKWGSFEEIYLGKVTAFRREISATHCFSPFALVRIKPIKEPPKKWTMAHVYRALINGQFADFRCNGKYSDDYAYDAAVNFWKGGVKYPLDFVRRIMESPSGWRCYESGGIIHINCHHFDNNSFKPVIDQVEARAACGMSSRTPE